MAIVTRNCEDRQMRVMKIKRPFQFLVAAFVPLIMWGCSELKQNSQLTNPFTVDVHPGGFASPSSSSFHGVEIQNNGWEIRKCQQCHNGLSPSLNAPSCTNSGCHVDANGTAKNPEACNTCHGTFAGTATDTLTWAPPRSTAGDTSTTARGVGAHQYHLIAAFMHLSKPVVCASCHRVPSSVYVAGHFDHPLPAQVTFLDPLALTPSAGNIPSPQYDPQSLTCRNTYCHGNFQLSKATSPYDFVYEDSVIAGANFSPLWTGGGSQAACGTCHGLPPAGHFDFGNTAKCTSCHYLDPSKQGGSLDKSIHMNGKIDLYGTEYSFR